MFCRLHVTFFFESRDYESASESASRTRAQGATPTSRFPSKTDVPGPVLADESIYNAIIEGGRPSRPAQCPKVCVHSERFLFSFSVYEIFVSFLISPFLTI